MRAHPALAGWAAVEFALLKRVSVLGGTELGSVARSKLLFDQVIHDFDGSKELSSRTITR